MKALMYSAKDAAAILGISAKTIRNAVHKGELPCVRYNRKTWRLSAVDVSAWYLTKRRKTHTEGNQGNQGNYLGE